MSVRVVAYAGSRGEEWPRVVVVSGRRLEVRDVLDAATLPEGRRFVVRLEDGSRWQLLCSAREHAWEARPLP